MSIRKEQDVSQNEKGDFSGGAPILPTLMIKGKLVSPTGDPSLQPALDDWIPYEYIIDWFRKRIHSVGIKNRTLILKSETASGKSTLLPPKIFEAFVLTAGKVAGIICTQPRIYTAKDNVLQMLANYKFLRLGENVGWSTGEDKVRPRNVGLLSATIGTLTQQLKVMSDDEIMRKYKFILIDETHERDLQTDLTIYMLKSLLTRQRDNPNCPFVVLMSATFEPDSFLKYFNITAVDNFIWCKGEAAGFDEMWDWNEGRTVNNYPQAAAQVVERIIREGSADEPERGDIFIFLPGAPEFRETTKYLNELNKKLAGSSDGKVGSSDDRVSKSKVGSSNGMGYSDSNVNTDGKYGDAKIRTCRKTGDDVCYCSDRSVQRTDRTVQSTDPTVQSTDSEDGTDSTVQSTDSTNQTKSGGGSIEGTSVFSILPIESAAVKGNTQAMRWITTPLKDQTVIISSGGKSHTYIPARRVILTTNVAETGVTVSSIKYVIDAGFNRGVEFNPVLGVTALLTKPAPQSRIRQRKGRAGRKFRGVFYPLYPLWIYEKLPALQYPQIITSDISGIILDIVFEQLRAKLQNKETPIFRLADIDMVDVPAVDAINSAIEKLFAIGFLRFNPAPWTGPTLADARAIVDPLITGLSHSAAFSEGKESTVSSESKVSSESMVAENTEGKESTVTDQKNVQEPKQASTIDSNIPANAIGFTRMGAIAAFIATPQLSPESIRMIFAAYSWGVDIAEIITIAAYLEIDAQKSLARTVDGKKVAIDWNAIYLAAFPTITLGSLRIITMDEFIDGLVLFLAVRNVVRTESPINKLSTWCEKVGITVETVFKFITDRDDLIDHFLANEFSINIRVQKLSETSIADYTDIITRIKHCIYDGFRCGLLTLGTDGKYVSSSGVKVTVPKFLAAKYKNVDMRGKVKPMYIITKSVGVKYNRETDIYDATPGLSSVMDGYVAIDREYTI